MRKNKTTLAAYETAMTNQRKASPKKTVAKMLEAEEAMAIVCLFPQEIITVNLLDNRLSVEITGPAVNPPTQQVDRDATSKHEKGKWAKDNKIPPDKTGLSNARHKRKR